MDISKLIDIQIIDKLDIPYNNDIINKELDTIYSDISDIFFNQYLDSLENNYHDYKNPFLIKLIYKDKPIFNLIDNMTIEISNFIDDNEFDSYYYSFKPYNKIYPLTNQMYITLIAKQGNINMEYFQKIMAYQLFQLYQDSEYLKKYSKNLFYNFDNINLYTNNKKIEKIANLLVFLFKNNIDNYIKDILNICRENNEIKKIEESIPFKLINIQLKHLYSSYKEIELDENDLYFIQSNFNLNKNTLDELIAYSIIYFNYRISKANTDLLLDKINEKKSSYYNKFY